MDPSQFSQPSQHKKDTRKPLFLLEMGLLEIGAVIVVLCLIFFLLNFLNILRFASVFPSLTFLPHLSATNTTAPDTSFKPSSILQDYVTQRLQKPYWISATEKTLSPKTTDMTYSLSWEKGNASLQASLSYAYPTAQLLQRYDVSVVLQKGFSYQGLIASNSSSLSEVFLNPPTIQKWNCRILPNSTTACDYITTENKTKIGYGFLVNAAQPNPTVSILYSCRILPNDSSYATFSSCLTLSSMKKGGTTK